MTGGKPVPPQMVIVERFTGKISYSQPYDPIETLGGMIYVRQETLERLQEDQYERPDLYLRGPDAEFPVEFQEHL